MTDWGKLLSVDPMYIIYTSVGALLLAEWVAIIRDGWPTADSLQHSDACVPGTNDTASTHRVQLVHNRPAYQYLSALN